MVPPQLRVGGKRSQKGGKGGKGDRRKNLRRIQREKTHDNLNYNLAKYIEFLEK
jgi:hypothetical protein